MLCIHIFHFNYLENVNHPSQFSYGKLKVVFSRFLNSFQNGTVVTSKKVLWQTEVDKFINQRYEIILHFKKKPVFPYLMTMLSSHGNFSIWSF